MPATRKELLEDIRNWFDEGQFQTELARRVAFATESDADPKAVALADYLHLDIIPALDTLGFESNVFPNPTGKAGPILVSTRTEDPRLPTLLTYGHGDVVSGQDADWREGLAPWKLIIEGDRWYGRGTADNKGQHTINFSALRHVIQARSGRLGFNVKVLMETGEEAGSPGLRTFCEEHRDLLNADLFIASDGPRVSADRPTLFLGSRGLVTFSLSVECRKQGYHSGNWGGVLRNPAIVLSHALAALVDASGRILVDGLRPPPISAEVRQALLGVPVGGGDDDPDVDVDWGEPELTHAERLVGWNTLEILAMTSGSPSKPVNAIPPTATAHCQLRFVPGTDWQALENHVRQHLDARGFQAVKITVLKHRPATRLDLKSPWVGWARNSLANSTEEPITVLPNLAGSLPNDVFAETLGLPTVWIPHSYPACSQHAPNEHLLGSIARQGLQIMAGVFWDLGESQNVPWAR